MNNFFKNKVVAISGGTSGIGEALVELFLRNGAKVATCGRNQSKLYDMQLTYHSMPFHCVVADVSKYNDCELFVNTTLKQFGKIDILINNAGISMRAMLRDADAEVFKKTMSINFFGAVYLTKLFLESLIENKGTIVGISSIAGFRGLPGRSGYSASKFALNGWLEAIRIELWDNDVNVLTVCPGFTKSNIRSSALNENAQATGESKMDEESMMTSEECAKYIMDAIEKRKRLLILTSTGKRTVFLNKFFPSLTDKLVKKFYFNKGKLVK